jgi:large subunit ribosomal protein L4
MSSVTLHKADGSKAGTVELAEQVFGVQPNVPVMHQVVVAQMAARRQGSQSTKTRAEVSGGGRKPFKQKGTGNARQGSTRAPHFSGGGVALGPKPRSYRQKTPKKMVQLALRSALSDRAADGKVVVVSDWGLSAPSTKAAKVALGKLGVEGKILVVLRRDDAAAAKSFRNLTDVQVIDVAELNTYDVLCNDVVVFTEATLPTQIGGGARTAEAPAATAPIAATVAAAAATDEPVAGPYPGSVLPLADGSTPAGYDIKGNADSGLYHLPTGRYYKATKAEFWFDTAASAEAAGFTLQGAAKDADAGSDASDDEAGES